MDGSLHCLQGAKEEVILSREWEELNRELFSQLQHLEYLQGGGELRSFANLTHQEKLDAIAKATRSLEKTKAFGDFQGKVSDSVDHHFSTRPAVASSSAEGLATTHITPSENVAKACSYLLQEWPHLTQQLKRCLNHPLPADLRVTAWKLLLQNPAARKNFLTKVTAQGGLLELTPEEKRIASRCEALLNSTPLFHEMADSIGILRTMKTTMLYWNLRSGSMVSDTELIVCIPFLYVRREELSRQNGENLSLVAEIVEQYVSFMETLPLTMHSMMEDHALEAMNKFALKVEQLLSSQDQKLHRALMKAFGCSAHTRAPSAISQVAQLPFHKRLRNVIHPHVQRMLVGDVSMELLCYLWDQCFIGMGSPDYQCLPYFIAVWLILLRDRLIPCHTGKAIEQALIMHSATLKVQDFQKQIEKRFLHKLASPLAIAPVRLKERVVARHSHKRELEPSTGEYRTQEDPEKERLKRQVTELRRQLEQEHKSLSDAITLEREEHKKEMESLMREFGALKQKVTETLAKSDSQVTSTSAPISSVPTNVTLVSPTGYFLSPEPRLQIAQSHPAVQSTLPVLSVVQQSPPVPQQSSTAVNTERPFSPSHLSKKDAQDIWLKILSRFTSAAYTVCHGTGEERQKLYGDTRND